MTEKLISLETAKLAKEKGFWISICPFEWVTDSGVPTKSGGIENYQLVPQSLLQKWLRDVKKQDIEITTAGLSGNYYCFVPQTGWGYIYEGTNIKAFPSYEEALEAGLLESLKLV